MRPATHLCWICPKNNNHIHRVANLDEAEKVEVVRQQESHLQLAVGKRDYYKNCCKKSGALTEHLEDGDFSEKRAPCTFEGQVHYSYDYAQQLHYPSDPCQPGPIFFNTPRKCAIFGVCCESIPRQVNFLMDGSVLTGKGANATISYVHYYFYYYLILD